MNLYRGGDLMPWDVGQERQRKKDMDSKYVVMSLGTDVECGGVQHNNMNCSSLSCQLLFET